MVTIVHIINQFFAGLGGEEKADVPVGVLEGVSGAARGLEAQLGERGKIVATVYYGDNYFHEHTQEAEAAILAAVRSHRPDVVVAGPAFNSGRYGLGCVEIGRSIADKLQIPCVTAMHTDNPAVANYRDYQNLKLFLLPSAETAAGMTQALASLARFACRLASGEKIGPAAEEGYISRGIRRLEKTDRPGVERAIEMLLKKVHNEPFVTEVPMEIWDQAPPASALKHLVDKTLAIVTTSGVVPWGNPDGFKTYRNTHWKKYNIAEVKSLEPGQWEAIHGGYNVTYMNQNPHYGVPLDAVRALEAEGIIGRGKLYPAYYVVPGNQGSPSVMKRIGQEIAADMKASGIDGVLLVAT
ncbi:MAG: glycine/betaine/sarcosine/D-proline family reductase selenoprotein B [Deltaproteobacteria bacterium]|nr:glycine/betaine/sarcosine/D-proline family reductase selenoprotein B [Deltaproteobacteria bacterium]